MNKCVTKQIFFFFCFQGEHESICECSVSEMVCGSDGSTYATICGLNEEATRRAAPDDGRPVLAAPPLAMEYWGPCKEAPVIISPPEVGLKAHLHDKLFVACMP